MRLLRLHLQDFRNIELARLELGGANAFLVGANGQGKTNLLEAAGLLGALRSFRTGELGPLIRQGHPRARLYWVAESTREGRQAVDLTIAPGKKTLLLDGERVGRLGAFLGRFPVVVMSSDDGQLLRGSPAGRRRFLDLLLSSVSAAYYEHLRQYHRGLEARNRLLKQPSPRAGELASFEEAMAVPAAALVALRRETIAGLTAIFAERYASFAEAAEAPALAYAPDTDAESAPVFRETWRADRERDARAGSTRHGPHRDDLELTLAGNPARAFGSEGQQRGLVLSLRLAQFACLRERLGETPLLLADDVLGELDPHRRRRFWASLDGEPQVLATGTSVPELPTGRAWRHFTVEAGAFEPEPRPPGGGAGDA